MDSGELEEIENLFSPLVEDYEDILKSIIIYGSAVRKERVEGSDIDVLVIVDDNSENLEESDLKEIKEDQETIKQKGEEKGYELHIQPPKPVSNWLNLLIQGRPWSVTAIKYSESIYDPQNFQSTLQKMVRSTSPESETERSLNLLQQAESDIQKTQKLLENSFEQLVENIRSSGRTYLKFHDVHTTEDEEIINGLESHGINLDFFREILELEEKIISNKRDLSFKELEAYAKKSLEFINEVNSALEEDIKDIREEVEIQAFKEMKESCKVLLEGLEIKYTEDNMFEKVREQIVKENILSEEYWKFIKETRKRKDEEISDQRPIYRPLAELRDFETAVDNILNNEFYKSFELRSNSETAQITPINEYENNITQKFEEIEGLYVLTKENLLETKSATLVLLVDDTEESRINKIKEYSDSLENRIGKEHGFNIHTETLRLTEFWRKVQRGEEKMIYEVKIGIVSYDPKGLLSSTEKLVKQGKIRNTVPNVISEFEETKIDILIPLEKIREEALEKYYKASIKIGQAVLLQKGIAPPVQKKVPEVLLESEAVKEGSITERDVKNIERIIETYKDKEYGKLEEFETSQLDKMRDDLEEIKNKINRN